MSRQPIFHLSIPVPDLDAARRFYVEVLSATVGRQADDWLDVLLWGAQVTLQLRPDEVLPPRQQGKRHFGVALPWDEWERAAEQVRASGTAFLAEPHVFDVGTPGEHAKFYLADPGHNVIEVKAYRDPAATLRVPDARARPAREAFVHRSLAQARFEDVDLHAARFDDVNLRDAAFTNIALAGATFRDVSFAGATIDDSHLDGMRIDGVLVSELFSAWRQRNDRDRR